VGKSRGADLPGDPAPADGFACYIFNAATSCPLQAPPATVIAAELCGDEDVQITLMLMSKLLVYARSVLKQID